MKKRRHHLVPQLYLKPWTTAGRIACLQKGRVFTTNIKNIAVEKDFYRLRELTELDITFLRQLILRFPVEGRKVQEGWLRIFNTPFVLRKVYQESGIKNADIEREIDDALSNLEENYLASIEQEAIPLLASLRQMDLGFFKTRDGFFSFIRFILIQYFRTKKMSAGVLSALGQLPELNVENCWGAIRHMLATNVGANFALRRPFIWLSFLRTNNESQFITGDQPVINTYTAQLAFNKAPENLELYYPITPRLAVLIGDENDKSHPGDPVLSAGEVEYYNGLILRAAYEQVFASAECLFSNITEAN